MHRLYELHARMCRIFTSPKRLEIINLLRNQELSVSDIMKLSKMNQANVSQHLCLLKEEDIVRTRRDGVKIYYSLATPKMIEAFDIMREILLDKIAKTEKLSRDVRRARKERT